jgi:hypothetical protein
MRIQSLTTASMWWRCLLAYGETIALLLASSSMMPSPLAAQQAARDSVSTLRAAVAATDAFLARWRVEWLSSDWDAWRQFQAANGNRLRMSFAAPTMRQHWCVYAWAPPLGLADPSWMRNRIASAAPLPSMICPSWTVENPYYQDASMAIDSAIAPARRDRIFGARDSLLRELAAAAASFPADGWLSGQRVRFMLDQAYREPSYFAAALDVARACRSDEWLCAALTGLVFARQQIPDSAQEAFARARKAATAALQCQMADVTVLMDRGAVPREFAMPTQCAAKVRLAERYWWLADPLWSDAINERRIEHDVRTAMLFLSASLPRSERFDWRVVDGGDAAAQLVTRYGWPSRMVWSAINQGRLVGTPPNHEEIKFRNGVDRFDDAPSPPFTTQEYAADRVHVSPSWTALIDPYSARAVDWQLSAPVGENSSRWWPSEHMRRDRTLVAIEEWQEQYWRRADSVEVAIAARVPTGMIAERGYSADIHAVLVRSPEPASMVTVDRRQLSGDATVHLAGMMPADSAVLSVELIGQGMLHRDARVRFAAETVASLRHFPVGTIALSTPALLRAGGDPGSIRTSKDAAEALLPSTKLRAGDRVGLYWESYGIQSTDVVDMGVQVHRIGEPRRFERIAAWLGVDGQQVVGTQIRWRETGDGSWSLSTGPVSILGRNVVLNLAGLRQGDYVVAITGRTSDGRSATSLRHFSIE